MITEEQLPYLIQLLDDTDPATQAALKREFASSGGDISNEITALALDIPAKDRIKLSDLLRPARRATLEEQWQFPALGVQAIADDWELFEHHLRIISDFLHDGISLRPPLPDMVDMLADEARDELMDINANELRVWMFHSGRFMGNREHFYLPENSDLCWVADSGIGNPISLATLYMLVANRLELDVSGCNYPGHFLARIYINGAPVLVDCFHKGRLLNSGAILTENQQISLAARMAIKTHASLGHILWRFLRNLEYAFQKREQVEDAKLFDKLAESMQ